MAPLLFLLLVIVLILTGFAVVTRPDSSSLTVREGRKMLATGDTERALHVFKYLASRRFPLRSREQATYWLVRTLSSLGRDDEALVVYADYIREFGGEGANADRLSSLRDWVRQRLVEGRPQGPQRPFKSFQESDIQGESDVRLLGLDDGVHLLESGRPKRALVVLKPALDYAVDAPGRERALLYLGLTYEALHRTGSASEAYRRYLSDYVSGSKTSHTKSVGVLVQERLRNLEEDREATARLPWEVFREGLAGIRERLGDAAASPPPVIVRPRRQDRVSPAELRNDLGLLDTGRKVGGYVLAEKLGEGGFGEVYRALRPVAIKFARGPESIERLRRLAELQGEVDSDRIVRPLEVDLTANPPFVVMEFVDGPNLRHLLQAGRLEPAAALAICEEIALGLSDAHKAGVWHLDLKPENVLLDPTGHVKLTDFEFGRTEPDAEGLQQSLALSQESSGGTLAYMSPEQRSGKAIDARSDVFTFGVLLFELLTGMLPEPGDKPSQFIDDLPEQVDAIFERCFARHERRYADASELVTALKAVLAAAPAAPVLRSVFARAQRLDSHAEVLGPKPMDAATQEPPAPPPLPSPKQSTDTNESGGETENAHRARARHAPKAERPSLESLIAGQRQAAVPPAEEGREGAEPLADPPMTA